MADDDLIARLRQHAENCAGRYDVTGYTVLREAADEIERLRAVIAEVQARHQMIEVHDQSDPTGQNSFPACSECYEQEWPCPTVVALSRVPQGAAEPSPTLASSAKGESNAFAAEHAQGQWGEKDFCEEPSDAELLTIARRAQDQVPPGADPEYFGPILRAVWRAALLAQAGA